VSGVDELVAFLRAALDRDEQVALAATAGPWRHDPTKHWRKPGTAWFEEAVFAGPAGADATCIAGTGVTDDPQSMDDAEHIARWDPARVLAEVEAKRRILDWCEARLHDAEDFPSEEQYQLAGTDAWLNLLRPLAQPYAGQDGWQEEWQLNEGA
jgi:hypothetical protein